jgi:hypothetical protein
MDLRVAACVEAPVQARHKGTADWSVRSPIAELTQRKQRGYFSTIVRIVFFL